MTFCEDCNQEMRSAKTETCTVAYIVINGELYKRDTSYFDNNKRCHDCGITNKKGNIHHFGCDMERCPRCKEQLISCDCSGRETISFDESFELFEKKIKNLFGIDFTKWYCQVLLPSRTDAKNIKHIRKVKPHVYKELRKVFELFMDQQLNVSLGLKHLSFQRRVTNEWIIPSKGQLFYGEEKVKFTDESPEGLYPCCIIPRQHLGKVVSIIPIEDFFAEFICIKKEDDI